MFENFRKDCRIHRSWKHRGLWALGVYRFGRWAQQVRFGPARWILSKIYGVSYILSQIVTQVSLDRETEVGEGFHIVSRSCRISIHHEAVIGKRLGLSHNVTIGNNMGDKAPVIGDDVFIGAGASILGDVRIGDGARIAANSLVITDVPAGASVMGVPAQVMPNMLKMRDPEEKKRIREAKRAARAKAAAEKQAQQTDEKVEQSQQLETVST